MALGCGGLVGSRPRAMGPQPGCEAPSVDRPGEGWRWRRPSRPEPLRDAGEPLTRSGDRGKDRRGGQMERSQLSSHPQLRILCLPTRLKQQGRLWG